MGSESRPSLNSGKKANKRSLAQPPGLGLGGPQAPSGHSAKGGHGDDMGDESGAPWASVPERTDAVRAESDSMEMDDDGTCKLDSAESACGMLTLARQSLTHGGSIVRADSIGGTRAVGDFNAESPTTLLHPHRRAKWQPPGRLATSSTESANLAWVQVPWVAGNVVFDDTVAPAPGVVNVLPPRARPVFPDSPIGHTVTTSSACATLRGPDTSSSTPAHTHPGPSPTKKHRRSIKRSKPGPWGAPPNDSEK